MMYTKVHGLDSHTKEKMEPQGNPYPTGYGGSPLVTVWAVQLCRDIFKRMNVLIQ